MTVAITAPAGAGNPTTVEEYREQWAGQDVGVEARSFWSETFRRFLHNRVGVVSVIVLLLLVAGAVFAPWLTSYDPLVGTPTDRLQGLFSPGHILGTDEQGRDIFARILYGGRLSLAAAFVPPVVATIIGTLVGTWSGTWTNTTFGLTGTAQATITSPDANTIVVAWDMSGNVFGCTDPQPTVLTLVNGTDWSAKGLKFSRTSPVFGAVTAKLTKGLALKASAPSSCGGFGPKWTLKGKIKKNVLKATIQIRFADGQVSKAKATLNVPKL